MVPAVTVYVVTNYKKDVVAVLPTYTMAALWVRNQRGAEPTSKRFIIKVHPVLESGDR